MIYAKAAACLVAWVFLAVVLMRGVVGPLWGSGTDIGLIAAPLVFAAGVLALAKLGQIMLQNLGMTRSTKGDEDHG